MDERQGSQCHEYILEASGATPGNKAEKETPTICDPRGGTKGALNVGAYLHWRGEERQEVGMGQLRLNGGGNKSQERRSGTKCKERSETGGGSGSEGVNAFITKLEKKKKVRFRRVERGGSFNSSQKVLEAAQNRKRKGEHKGWKRGGCEERRGRRI